MALIPRCYVGDLELTDYPFSLAYNELDLGTSPNVMTFFDALLADGSIGTSLRTENRTLVVPIYVEGSDLLDLARNEETLVRACEAQRNTFTLDPGDGIAPATVYETFRIQADHGRDDNMEGAFLRRWVLTIPAMPWARSVDPTTQTFTPTTTTIVSVDDGSATTLWSDGGGEYPLAISSATYLGDSVIAAAFSTTAADKKAHSNLRWKPATSAGMPTTTYVALDVLWSPSSVRSVGLNDVDNVAISSEQVTLGAGTYTRYYFLNPHRTSGGTPATAASALTFHFRQRLDVASSVTNRVGGLSSATGIGATPTLTLAARGSVRSPATIRYQKTVGSNRTRFLCYADPILLEGFNPASQGSWASAPDGTYVLYAVTPWTSAVAGDVLAVTVTDSAGRAQTVTTRLTTEHKNRALWPIGEVQLGGFDSGVAGALTLSSTRNGAASAPAAYRLFRKHPDAALTYLDTYTNSTGATTAIASRDFRIDAPSLERPNGGVFIDGVSAYRFADPWDFPMVVPPTTALYIEDSSASTQLETTATYYPRARYFAAD